MTTQMWANLTAAEQLDPPYRIFKDKLGAKTNLYFAFTAELKRSSGTSLSEIGEGPPIKKPGVNSASLSWGDSGGLER